LVEHLRSGRTVPHLDQQLLQHLLRAAIWAPGFSEFQKALLVVEAGFTGMAMKLAPFSFVWPFEVLGVRPNIQDDVIAVS
jgi:hypothetical protein